MAEIKIFPRDKTLSWMLPTGQRHRLLIHRFKAYMVELEDLHFHFDSAVVMPDRDPADAIDEKSGAELTALSVIRTCYLYARANPDKKLLCLGHTDRSGPPDYNLKLSKHRAQNLWALMMGKRDDWTALCVMKHVVRDYQLILKWIANVRYWPECDPGPVDDDHGQGTSKALRAFKRRFKDAYGVSLADSAVVDKPTWDAFYKMYMTGLAGLMQMEESGLAKYRQVLNWLPPAWNGCGGSHPITADGAANYRSPVDRRVELLFFDPGDEPQLGACHPSEEARTPAECELYRKTFLGKPFYIVKPIVVDTNAKVALRLSEIRGLYQPGFSDPADVSAETDKLSGYCKGYKSEDDLGRIFVNQIPRVDPSVSWEDIKKKNQQYIELVATIDVAAGMLPADAQVVWEWSDPDDPSDTDMRDDAAAIVDPKDFENGKRVANKGDDNNGDCDFPSESAGKEPAFEQMGVYTLTPDAAGSKRCFTLVSGGKSEVRFHCTDAGGDNFRLQATVRPAPGLMVTAGDKTGIMTMWKRIDVEHRRMESAEKISAKEIAPFFEKQFVQMDVAREELARSNAPFVSPNENDDRSSEFAENEFKNKYKPGWFFICVAREAEPPVGGERHSLYEGPGKLIVGGSVPLVPPSGNSVFEDENLPQWESLEINAVVRERPMGVRFHEGGKTIGFRARDILPNVPPGKSTIRLRSIDFQSDFEPGDGSEKKAYEKRAFYFPRYRYRWPEQVWEKKGYGFPDDVYVNVVSMGSATTDGISPSVANPAGFDCFAGRTIIFSRHPAHTKRSTAIIEVGGGWSRGDVITVTVDGISATYKVAVSDVTVPPGVPDRDLYVRGQVARGIEGAINGSTALLKKATAIANFGKVAVRSTKTGAKGDGTPISIAQAPAPGSTGVLTLSGPHLTGGGFDEAARQEILATFTHELGHAFGFPHKCGYHASEKTPGTSCTMNYDVTWLYKLGTHLVPAAREVERFGPGNKGRSFCAHHTRGIRLVQLEKNLAIWKWK